MLELLQDNWVRLVTFTGGLLTGLLGFYLNNGKLKQDDIRIILDGYKGQIDLIQKSYSHLEKKLTAAEDAENHCMETSAKMLAEMNQLKASMTLLKASSLDIPVPMWFKDINGVMLSLNNAYEETFLLPLGKTRDDCIGKTDYEVWGSDVANQYSQNDKEATSSQRPITVYERVNVGNGIYKKFMIVKYPSKIAGLVLGVVGIALPRPEEKTT